MAWGSCGWYWWYDRCVRLGCETLQDSNKGSILLSGKPTVYGLPICGDQPNSSPGFSRGISQELILCGSVPDVLQCF